MPVLCVGLVSALSGILFGYNAAVVAGALTFIAEAFALSTVGRELVVASILAGAFVGAMSSGHLAGRLGPRRVLLLACLLFVGAPVGIALAGDAVALGLWRAALGLAVGIVSMVTPLYVAEASPARRRGALVSLFQLGVTAGILGAYLVDWAFTADAAWRWMFGLGAVPGALLALTLLPLPESPRWLGRHGRSADAGAALRRLLGSEAAPTELDAPDPESATRHAPFSALLVAPVRSVLIVAAGLFLFQNLSGIDGILYYAPEIFRSVGIPATTGAILATAGLGTVNLLATVVAMAVVDRLGRRPLLIGGLAAMTACLALLGILLALPGSSGAEAWITLGCLAGFVLAFALSMGPLPYVLMSELFPARVRETGMSLAAATSWLLNLVVAMTFLVLLDALGAGSTFLVYAAVCLAALVFSWLTVPETRGRTLAEIEANLEAGHATRHLGRPPDGVAQARVANM